MPGTTGPTNRDQVIATWDDDPAQYEPFLVCQRCAEKLCSVEEGDSFHVLVTVVDQHECGPMGECPSCGSPRPAISETGILAVGSVCPHCGHVEPGDDE